MGGRSLQRLGVIKVNTVTATYAITHLTGMTRGLEVAKGIVTSNAPEVNLLREISESDVQSWRKSKELIT